jgi:hypothetical protein
LRLGLDGLLEYIAINVGVIIELIITLAAFRLLFFFIAFCKYFLLEYRAVFFGWWVF